ncbi:MAG: hypothetical protein MMC33_005776 [Icmadophila ericetorum]|nr:hypothetical protein [Icmadophila ericetorum]
MPGEIDHYWPIRRHQKRGKLVIWMSMPILIPAGIWEHITWSEKKMVAYEEALREKQPQEIELTSQSLQRIALEEEEFYERSEAEKERKKRRNIEEAVAGSGLGGL